MSNPYINTHTHTHTCIYTYIATHIQVSHCFHAYVHTWMTYNNLQHPLSKIYAFDMDACRFKLMQDMLSKAGVGIVESHNKDFLTIFPGASPYDQVQYILVDPSCSGSGEFLVLGAQIFAFLFYYFCFYLLYFIVLTFFISFLKKYFFSNFY